MNEIPQRTDEQVVKELAREAKSLMENRAFKAALGLLERKLQAEMMACPHEQVVAARAAYKAAQDFPKMLEHLISSERMMARRNG